MQNDLTIMSSSGLLQHDTATVSLIAAQSSLTTL